jgi:hypothetical protein
MLIRIEHSPDGIVWSEIGTYLSRDITTKNRLFDKADRKAGLVRVVDTHSGKLIFQRPTAITPRVASDDCHTFD